MKRIVKQVVGVDVAQEELVVRFGSMYDDWVPELGPSKAFENTAKGFDELTVWVNKWSKPEADVRYVMEATGVYHENFAYFLDEHGYAVSIVLPSKISNYVRTLEKKTVTDSTAAEAITRFGLERKLEQWSRPQGVYRKMRQLTRERSQLIELKTICTNQLHAEQTEAQPGKKTIVRLKKRIELLNRQESEIQTELKELINSDEKIKQLIALLCSITGVGVLTASIVLGETNGFDLIRSKKQLTSYAGLDVKEKQSGTSVKGKPKISKRGNKYLRKAMHFPALTAIRHDERYKAVYARLISRHGIKMKAAVAVQRKILEMMFTVFSKKEKYDKTYLQNNTTNEQALSLKKD